jgi:hypothetical protein
MSGEVHGCVIPGKDPLAHSEGKMDPRAELDDLEIRLMDIYLAFSGNRTPFHMTMNTMIDSGRYPPFSKTNQNDG